MITLHIETYHNGYTYRQGNHIGRIFSAASKNDFKSALTEFRSDMGVTPYTTTDDNSDLSPNSASFINQE